MKTLKAFFFGLLFCCKVLCQQKEILSIAIAKDDTNKDSCCIYNMSIKNRSDSTLCILHSIFIRLTLGSPQGLALIKNNNNEENYNFQYSFKDTAYDLESSPFWGELILPHQTLSFKIRILPSNNDKTKHLSFEYLYLNDFSYKKFMGEMKHVGSWYYKYTRMKKSIDFPK